MNKRARLTRRILREHRRGTSGHYAHYRWHVPSQRWQAAWHPIRDIWVCPHCVGYDSVRPKGVPVAYC